MNNNEYNVCAMWEPYATADLSGVGLIAICAYDNFFALTVNYH